MRPFGTGGLPDDLFIKFWNPGAAGHTAEVFAIEEDDRRERVQALIFLVGKVEVFVRFFSTN
jgi:hypothetical protein